MDGVSDTGLRFTLLVIGTLLISITLFQRSMYLVLDEDAHVSLQLDCADRAGERYGGDSTLDTRIAIDASFEACIAPDERRRGLGMLVGVALVIGVAGAAQLLWPLWRIRRRRLVPLPRDALPALADRVARLSREAALPRPPVLVWSPADPHAGALAMGRVRRPQIAMGAGLVALFLTDDLSFDAVVRHELAHIRNRDVARGAFAVTLVPALLLVGVLPFLVRSLQEALSWWELAISPAWRLPLLLAVIYLLRNSVLRAREHHADLTAAAGGQVGKLDAVLSRLRAPRGGWLGGALSYHPSPERRRAVIADPRLVGRASPWLLLVAALLVGGGLRPADLLFEALVAGTPAAGWPLPLIALSTLLGGLVGLVVWRETAAYGRPPGVARSAVLGGAAGAGVALGNGLAVTTSDSFVGDTNLPWQTNLLGAAAMVVTILVMIVLVCWSGCCASILRGLTWLDRPRRFVTLGALLAAGVCGWSLPPAIELAQQARAIEWGGTAIVVLDQIGGYRAWLEDTLFTVAHDLVLTTSVLIALWAVPLAVAVLRSRRPGALPNADYAGAAAAARRALLCGVAGSVAVLAELLVVPHGGSHWWLTRRSVALAIVVLTGCIAVGLSRRQRLLAGWAAASVCGVGTILAGLMSALIHGTDITVQNFIYPLWAVTNTGTLAALPVVVLAVAVVEAVAGARRRA